MPAGHVQLLHAASILYESANIPVVITDAGLNVLWANAAAVDSLDRLSGLDGLITYIPKKMREEIVSDILAEKHSVVFVQGIKKRITFTPLGGESLLTICTFEELLIEERQLSTLAYHVREPLFYIFTSANHLMRQLEDNKQDNENYEIAKAVLVNAYKLLRTSHMQSEYSKYLFGTQGYEPGVHNFPRFMDKLCTSISAATKTTEIPFFYAVTPQPIYVHFMPEKMAMALLNIVSNAFIYTKPHNVVNLSVELVERSVAVTISDSGRGLSSSQLEHVFDPFYSIGAEGIPLGGLGLGLTLARLVIHEAGGTISIKSQPDMGTHVTIILPVVQELPPDITVSQVDSDMFTHRFSRVLIDLASVEKLNFFDKAGKW